MDSLCDPASVKALLARYGFHFSKRMGQNFLIDGRIPRRIAEECGADRSCGVLEIGPGIGALTVQLAARAGRVAAIELDNRLLPVLAETLGSFDNTAVISGDALRLDLSGLVSEQFAGLTPIACANLPYQITTPAITALLEAGCFRSVTVMIQREVARRICAGPGDTERGAFSVFCQYYARPRPLFDVPPGCFLPAPKVTSTVLRLEPYSNPAVQHGVCDPDWFFQLTRAAFAQRRKTLCNALAACGLPKGAVRDALRALGLPEDVRGERLSIPEFAALAVQVRK